MAEDDEAGHRLRVRKTKRAANTNTNTIDASEETVGDDDGDETHGERPLGVSDKVGFLPALVAVGLAVAAGFLIGPALAPVISHGLRQLVASSMMGMGPLSSTSSSGMTMVVAASSCSGVQGAAMVDLLLTNVDYVRGWELRCLTTNANSAKVQQFVSAGVRVVEVERRPTGEAADREADLALLGPLLEGATSLFLVLHSEFEHPGRELALGRLWADAALANGVQHLVLSGGPRTGVALLDAKADVEAYVRSLPFERTLFLHTSFFFENLVWKDGRPRIAHCGPDADEPREVVFTNPLPADFPVVMHSAACVGRAAAIAFLQPTRFQSGQALRIVGSRCTPDEFATAFTVVGKATGVYRAMDLGTLQQAAFPDNPAAAAAVTDMYRAYLNSSLLAEDRVMDVTATRAAFPEAYTLLQWMRRHGNALVHKACKAAGREEKNKG